MRVSQLQLPDPLELDFSGEASSRKKAAAAMEGTSTTNDSSAHSECSFSDDLLSLPSHMSTAGLEEEENSAWTPHEHSSHSSTRLEMSVASRTRKLPQHPEEDLWQESQLAASTNGEQYPDSKDNDDAFSIISAPLSCPPPSDSIMRVATPATPPLPLSSDNISSAPKDLAEYLHTLSTIQQNDDTDEHQRNFDQWLKSVSPYSAHGEASLTQARSARLSPTKDTNGRSMSSLKLDNQIQSNNLNASICARYLRPHSVLQQSPGGRQTGSNHQKQTSILQSALSLHSSDVSVSVPAATASPASVKNKRQPYCPPTPTSPLSSSYAAAWNTIEQLCETADESESSNEDEEEEEEEADVSFATAATSPSETNSRLHVMSNEYEAGDELASYASSSDSAWETELASDSDDGSQRCHTPPQPSLTSLYGVIQALSSVTTACRRIVPYCGKQRYTRRQQTSPSTGTLASMLVLACSVLLCATFIPTVSDPTAIQAVATGEPVDVEAILELLRPRPSTAEQATDHHISLPLLSTSITSTPASTMVSSTDYLQTLRSLASYSTTTHLEYLVYFLVSWLLYYTIKKCKAFLAAKILPILVSSPPTVEGRLRYVKGRKIVIRPTPRPSKASEKEHASPANERCQLSETVKDPIPDQEQGKSKDKPILIDVSDPATLHLPEEITSSSSSIATVTVTAGDAAGRSASSRKTRSSSLSSSEAKENKKNDQPFRTMNTVATIASVACEVGTPRYTRARTASPAGSDRVLRSHLKRGIQKDGVDSNSSPLRSSPVIGLQGCKAGAAKTTDTKERSTINTSMGARTEPHRTVSNPAYSRQDQATRSASTPLKDRRNETFHVCFIHGAKGVGKASLLQRVKRGTFFDPAHPTYPGPESLQEFKELHTVQHLHFEKGEKVVTLVFGYGRMMQNRGSDEAVRWQALNDLYTHPDTHKSKFSKRGKNVHLVLYTAEDKASQAFASAQAAAILAAEPSSHVALIMTKCDSPNSAELQAFAHRSVQASLAESLMARGCEEKLASRVSQYKSSAKTTAGVDATFRDIARKLRKSMDIVECDASLPMQID